MAWTHRVPVLFALLALGLPASAQPRQPGPGPSPASAEPGDHDEGPGDAPKGEEPGDGEPSRPHPWDGMDLSLDVGAGLLEWFHADLTFLISRRWTIGVGLGFFPVDAVLRRVTGLDSFEADVESDIDGLRVHGEVRTQLLSGALFARVYPWRQTFYLEANLSLWTLKVEATGEVTHDEVDETLPLGVTARVWVPMAGLHLGWRFYFQIGLYIDLGLGINALLAPDARVDISGGIPPDVQVPAEVADEVDQMIRDAQTAMSSSLRKGANAIPDAIPVFPTIYLRLGWAFDFNPR